MSEKKSSTTVTEVMRRTSAWRMQQFGEQSPVRHALQICEEAGEVARAVGKADEGIRPDSRGDLVAELADVVMSACGMAGCLGLDLDSALQARLGRMERLDFRADPEGGRSAAPADDAG